MIFDNSLVEGVMLMGKSQRNVIARNAVTEQTPEGKESSPGPGQRSGRQAPALRSVAPRFILGRKGSSL